MKSKADGLRLQAYRWDPAGTGAGAKPRGLVVLAHGAAEHALRYERLAGALNAAGLSLWALDHRGHGASPGPAGLGDLGAAGWQGLVADVVQLIEGARSEQPGLPLALLGHSMGSFAAQQLCLDHCALLDALVLSGSTALEAPPDGQRPPPFTPNASFEPARTPYDWLSRDPAEVDKYIADPLCGFDASRRTFDRQAVRMMSDPQKLSRVRAELPILLLAGDADPLNRQLLRLHALEARYRQAGVKRVDTLYYEGGRHEMFNEINREQVTADLIAWLRDALSLAPA